MLVHRLRLGKRLTEIYDSMRVRDSQNVRYMLKANVSSVPVDSFQVTVSNVGEQTACCWGNVSNVGEQTACCWGNVSNVGEQTACC